MTPDACIRASTEMRSWWSGLVAGMYARRLRKRIAHLEWWEKQLARSQVETRALAEAARVNLAKWER